MNKKNTFLILFIILLLPLFSYTSLGNKSLKIESLDFKITKTNILCEKRFYLECRENKVIKFKVLLEQTEYNKFFVYDNSYFDQHKVFDDHIEIIVRIHYQISLIDIHNQEIKFTLTKDGRLMSIDYIE